jgi:hypothetical protein
MNTYRPLVYMLTVVTLSACATATPYQPLKSGEGYAEQKIESNRYRITFNGNSNTKKQAVENFMLYRAAEITLANGADYFVMADQNTEADTRYTQMFNGIGGDVFATRGMLGVGVGVGTSIPSTEYQAQADVLIYKGKKPENNPRAYDARQIQINLGPLIKRPQ